MSPSRLSSGSPAPGGEAAQKPPSQAADGDPHSPSPACHREDTRHVLGPCWSRTSRVAPVWSHTSRLTPSRPAPTHFLNNFSLSPHKSLNRRHSVAPPPVPPLHCPPMRSRRRASAGDLGHAPAPPTSPPSPSWWVEKGRPLTLPGCFRGSLFSRLNSFAFAPCAAGWRGCSPPVLPAQLWGLFRPASRPKSQVEWFSYLS